MNAEFLIRSFIVAVVALAFGWGALSMHDEEAGQADREHYGSITANWLLPFYFLLLILLSWFIQGPRMTMQEILELCFGTILHLSLYYAVLLPLLPRLRNRISARACALLWMTPNYLYLFFRTDLLPPAKWVLRPPVKLVWTFFGIWLAGVCAVLLWKIAAHLVFRRRILREAREVQHGVMRSIWESEWEQTGVKKIKCKLVISPAVTTPLSVGLFRHSTCVVLPDQSYSPEDLTLILRHEILHVCRSDTWAKFFLAFCTAMCWFNPLMWIAMKRCAEDLELSCDEAVLIGAGEETRRRYASLILSAAGDERGFTTCLSASAEALRYRLKNIVQPRKLRSGALVVGLLFFLFSMSFGYVALAYDSGSGAELIFGSHTFEEVELGTAKLDDNMRQAIYDPFNYDPKKHAFRGPSDCRDEEALFDYFASLTLDTTTGGDPAIGHTREDFYHYTLPEGLTIIRLTDRALDVNRLYAGGSSTTYYLPDGADWDYIDSLFTVYPALRVTLDREGDAYPKTSTFTLQGVWDVTDGGRTLIYGSEEPLGDHAAGIFGHDLYETAVLQFSIPTTGTVTFTAENWDRTTSRTEEVIPGESFSLPNYSAHYTVRAAFPFYDGKTVEAVFAYDLALMQDTQNGPQT